MFPASYLTGKVEFKDHVTVLICKANEGALDTVHDMEAEAPLEVLTDYSHKFLTTLKSIRDADDGALVRL